MDFPACDPERLIRESEVAALYSVDESTVRRWYKAGRLPPPVIQRKKFVRWRYGDIVEHIQGLKAAALQEAAS